jgi:adenosylhomocysteine nucleosidase
LNKRTAIIAAMPAELKPLTRGWLHSRSNGVDLWRWSFDGGEWIAACAGAGVERAARAFIEVEKSGEVDLVISVGWAGALREELLAGRAYDVSCVIDARTGERFLTKSHPSRKNKDAARVGHPGVDETAPRSENPDLGHPDPDETQVLRLRCAPLRMTECGEDPDLWLVTVAKVADEAEKKHLAATYEAGLVEMEAAGVARLVRMRGIPFYCIKGISDGYSDKLPDFNRFISADGHFQLVRFVFFVVPRPWYWPALIRMGENSKRAARSIAVSVRGLLDERENLRRLNDYSNQQR